MRDVPIPFSRPVGVTVADLVDFAECARFYAIRQDWKQSRDVLLACATELENECAIFAMQVGAWT
jgi:hypothetical protein